MVMTYKEASTVKIAKRARGTILLATDFSKSARRAFTYALKFSSILKMDLILLHVVKAPPGFEAWSPSARRSLHPLQTKALLELGRMARLAKDDGIATEHRLIVGIPEDSIVKIARETRADLITIGTHGRTGWDRLQLGNTAEALLRNAPCPVLTVHAATVADAPLNQRRVKVKRMLVALDFSAPSEAALRAATRLAQQFDARAILVHALGPSASSQPGRGHAGESAGHRADRQFQRAVAAAQAEPCVVDRIVERGNPVDVILDQARRVMTDLIVMGTNGRRGVERLVLGSVAESVVRRAGCPVLVVKGGIRDRGT
jgi:nucleotide-binding universal stress UspA family protein